MTETQGEHFFESNGVPIRYTVEGDGQAVVLLHGLTPGRPAPDHADGVPRQRTAAAYHAVGDSGMICVAVPV
jgi:hypothetical protein